MVGDTQTLLAGNTLLNFIHSQVVGMQKLSPISWVLVLALPLSLALTLIPHYKPPFETFTT